MDDKYTITLSDGSVWTYAPRGRDDLTPWEFCLGRWRDPGICRTPADFRACADVVERWERDHAPKMRRRVVQVGYGYYARHETLNGWVYGLTEEQARGYAAERLHSDAVRATDEVIDALLSLRDQPDEDVPNGE